MESARMEVDQEQVPSIKKLDEATINKIGTFYKHILIETNSCWRDRCVTFSCLERNDRKLYRR